MIRTVYCISCHELTAKNMMRSNVFRFWKADEDVEVTVDGRFAGIGIEQNETRPK